MLVLASASPRRREILERLGVAFLAAPVLVDETPPAGVSAEEAACAVAERKVLAAAAAARFPVLAADTMVVAADGEILGKPLDAGDARRMLSKLSGTTHRVVTAVALMASAGVRPDVRAATTLVSMRPLTAV